MTYEASSVMGIDPSAECVEFGGLAITFDHRVLRPRPWTLAQAKWAAELMATAPPGPVLELCAGVGHIGLAATRTAGRDLVLVDLNAAACEFAVHNAEAAGMGGRVDVREGPMERAVEPSESFAMIIADPPWVPTTDTGRFPDDPLIAIDGGNDGLELALVCCEVIGDHLAPEGDALLQLGSTGQADLLRDHLNGKLGLVECREYDAGVVVRLHF